VCDLEVNLKRLKDMKVILLKDVAKIGKRFSVVEVPDGYASNQLIPKKMAEPATPINLKKIERRQTEMAASKQASDTNFEVARKALLEQNIKVSAEANEQGHLFKAVHEAEIVSGAGLLGVSISTSMLKIPSPIKKLGEHEVLLLQAGKQEVIKIEIIKK